MDAELPTHLELHQAEEITHESTTSSPPEFSGSFTAQKQSRPGDCEDLDNAQYSHGLFVKSQLKKEKPTQEAVRETRPRSPSNITLAVKKLGVSDPFSAFFSLYLAQFLGREPADK